MLIIVAVGLLAVSTLWAQEPTANTQPPPPAVQSEAPTTSLKQTIIIPAGTRIPLSLSGPISSKSRPGNPVRAVTGFPVTVGTQLAIPVGSYVEGAIDKVTKGGRSGPSLQMHFTRLTYVNGYSVDIDGANVQAKAHSPNSSSSETAGLVATSGPYNSLAGQASTFPTVPPPASHTGAVVGLAIGGAAATVAIVLLGHYHGGSSGVLFDTGWQFEMVLESPLSVDATSVAEAAAHSRTE